MDRRKFLTTSLGAAAISALAGKTTIWAEALRASAPRPEAEPALFRTDVVKLSTTFQSALSTLSRNIISVAEFPSPVLIEGSVYRGIWLECGPQEGLVYSLYQPAIGAANHRVFFDLQRDDGYLPYSVKQQSKGASQIQMVVPIAATALDYFERFGGDEFLDTAYRACGRWDAWLMRYRNTRGTGLCEGFCTYDTGHDRSPRWQGMPNQCEDKDARICPKAPGLPRLCPDLSATVYGGRVALAKMARILGKTSEVDRWEESAETIRKLILSKLYVPEDAFFYDLDADNHFVRVRGDVITRVVGEHVVDQKMFEEIYARQLHNPKAFWAPYPLPSIALDDPTFVRPIPRNSWGGASQALTALRATRWMEHYGKPADLAHLMQQWIKAIVASGGFYQQMDPATGECTTTDPNDYSPAALVFLDFLWRLHGVRQDGEQLEWNCRRPENSAETIFSVTTKSGAASLKYASEDAELSLGGKVILRIKGTGRVITDANQKPLQVVGTAEEPGELILRWPDGKTKRLHTHPNTTIAL
ncbi:MAG: MGH1-like glycoside hydrolase domain-containing protein [Candidatus Acidiferrales bacterium]